MGTRSLSTHGWLLLSVVLIVGLVTAKLSAQENEHANGGRHRALPSSDIAFMGAYVDEAVPNIPASVRSPAVSADGQWLSYVLISNNAATIETTSARSPVATTGGPRGTSPVWLSNLSGYTFINGEGAFLARNGQATTPSRIFAFAGRSIQSGGFSSSPNERWFVHPARDGLTLLNRRDNSEQNIPNAMRPRWSRDGVRLYFTESNGSIAWQDLLTPSSPRHNTGFASAEYAVSPDGAYIAFLKQEPGHCAAPGPPSHPTPIIRGQTRFTIGRVSDGSTHTFGGDVPDVSDLFWGADGFIYYVDQTRLRRMHPGPVSVWIPRATTP